jgi:hypothetical protein
MSEKQIYKIVFLNRDEVYEIYAKHVFQGDLYGFVAAEDFVFGENSSIVIDPSEEKLKAEFEGVKRSFIPMHEIMRIDQVERRGAPKIVPLAKGAESSSKVSKFYVPEKPKT